MAAVAQIVIQVDEKGAVTAINSVKNQMAQLGPAVQTLSNNFDQLGPPILNFGKQHKQVFNGVESDYMRGREAAMLLAETTGVQVPRALQKVLAQSTLIGPALQVAFNASVILAAGIAAVSAAQNLGNWIQSLRNYGQDMKVVFQDVLASQTTLRGKLNFAEISDQLSDLERQQRKYRDVLGETETVMGGLTAKVLGFTEAGAYARDRLEQLGPQIAALRKQQELLRAEQMHTEPIEIMKLSNQAVLAGAQGYRQIALAAQGARNVIALEETNIGMSAKLAAAQREQITADEFAKRKALAVQYGAALRAIENQTAQIGAGPLAQIALKASAEIATFNDKLKVGGLSPQDVEQIEKQKSAIIVRQDAETLEQTRKMRIEEGQALLQADAETATGRAKIEADHLVRMQQITQEEIDMSRGVEGAKLTLTGKRIAEQERLEFELAEFQRRNAEETRQIEEQAAVDILPPWQRAYAQIAVAAEQEQRKIDEAFKRSEISADDWARRTTANATEQFAHMRDQLASDLEGAFDDLVSGNLGKRVKKMFEDMVFQMIATWLLGMNTIKQATQGVFSGIGAPAAGGGGILGTLGGILGIGSPGGSGAGGITTPPFFPGPAFFTPGSNASGGIFSGLPALSAGTELSPGTGVYASTVGALGLPIGIGLGLPGTISTPSKAGAAAANAGPLAGMLAKLFPHGTIGGKNIGAALGMLGVTLGVDGFMRLLSGQGGVGSAIETIGGAALTGFAIGGPVGAVVGGIVGAIGAFFGWLFGSDKVKKQREQLQTQLEQQLKLLTDSYDLHKTDYSTAISDAEQLRTQFEQAQDQVKKGGDMQKYVGQWVDQAEKHINDFETERVRRSEVMANLPLPEFAAGGFTPGYLPAGAMPALLHPNEAILNPQGRHAIGDQVIRDANAGTLSAHEAAADRQTHRIEIGGITINAAPGMDEQAVAQAVIRRIRQLFGDRGLNFGGVTA
ncbi:MAG: hypothetical protein LAN18_05115 [Acidobacteriia bacterium]|nr:hypothetical protein [Terriglobia bacterium]